ncbi:hypothetical protein MTO96_036983 [Rhipicephalus appendiculatus]
MSQALSAILILLYSIKLPHVGGVGGHIVGVHVGDGFPHTSSRSAGDESLEETGGRGLSKPGDKHRSKAAGDVARAEPVKDGCDRREVDDVARAGTSEGGVGDEGGSDEFGPPTEA